MRRSPGAGRGGVGAVGETWFKYRAREVGGGGAIR